MTDIQFDEATHTYTVDGKEIPGVTDILKTLGLSKDYTGIDPFYRDRGKAFHLAAEYYFKGTLDESTLDTVIVPYFDDFRKWLLLNPSIFMSGVEKVFYSKEFNFCGTVDLITPNSIIDYKCSKSHDPVAELQGALYKVLVEENMTLCLPFSV